MIITHKSEFDSVWGLTVKQVNGKKKTQNLLCAKGYKNKTKEMEELFSVCSGEVYPNNKLSRGGAPTS